MFHVGIDDEHGDGGIGHRHQFRFPRAAIEEQDTVFLTQDGNELVHDAARHAGVFVLGLLTKQHLFHRIKLPAGDDFEQGGHGHFERSTAGKAATHRHGRVNQRVEAAGIQSTGQKTGDDAGRIICPGTPRKRLERPGEINHGRLVAVDGPKPDQFCAWRRAIGGNDGIALNRHRKNKTIVVIGVLTNEVDATGCGGNPTRLAPVNLGKLLGRLSGQFFEGHR